MAKGKVRRFGEAEQLVVVAALAGGATVPAAAAAAGFSKSTLYNRRDGNPGFAAAWAQAVEESARPMLVAPRGGRRWQAQRQRRTAFSAARKIAFLEHFAVTCDTKASAAAAGVSKWIALAHRRSDPAFAEG